MQLISEAFPIRAPEGRMTLQGIRSSKYAQTPVVRRFEELLTENSWSKDFEVNLVFVGPTLKLFITSPALALGFTLPETSGGDPVVMPTLGDISRMLAKKLALNAEKLTQEKKNAEKILMDIERISETLKAIK